MTPERSEWDEADYRRTIQDSFDRIERAFENVDPDVVECEQQFGALTLSFPDKTKCILSAQPSVRQLWLALAARGVAYHFNYDATAKRWVDDKGRPIELLSFLEQYLKEAAGLNLKF